MSTSGSKQINERYLIGLVFIVGLTVTGFGVSLVNTDLLAETYQYKLGWTDEERANKVKWMTSVSAFGLMIGSLISSSVIKQGRRRSNLMACIFLLIGAVFQLKINFTMLIIGKLVYAIASAVMVSGGAVYLSEMLPKEKVRTHGFAVNAGVNLGKAFVLILGALVPQTDGTNNWLLVAFIPIIFAVCIFLMWLLVFKNEPLGFCMKMVDQPGYREQALQNIKKLYHTDGDQQVIKQLYQEMLQSEQASSTKGGQNVNVQDDDSIFSASIGSINMDDNQSEKNEEQVETSNAPNSYQVLTDPLYRKATYIGIILAIFNQICGINAICFYTKEIFESMFEDADAIKTGIAMTGVTQVIGVFMSPLLGKVLKVKTILVSGAAVCTICMSLVALFSKTGNNVLELVFISLFLISFQASQGCFYWPYVGVVCQEAGLGLANFTFFTFILLFAFCTQGIFDVLGNTYTFTLFAFFNLMATMTMAVSLKDIDGLSKQESQQLYQASPTISKSGNAYQRNIKNATVQDEEEKELYYPSIQYDDY